MEGLAGDGVLEVEEVGVEVVAAVAGEAGEMFERLAGGAVEGVADQGMADGGEVDSDLVRAAGVQRDLEGGGARSSDSGRAREDLGYGL